VTSLTGERLFNLLPAVHRLRDQALSGDPAKPGPLKALIAALAREFSALEESLDQLYDDQFIETCAEWVAPYIGDLIGYRPLHGVAPKVASPRAEVANTIAFRRRKGTALMLEQLAHDVTGWPAHAVEFFEQLATTQYMKHVRLHAPATADLRKVRALFERDGAFNAIAHTAEMRRPETGAGRYNIPNIGLFLWRLLSLSLTAVPLTPAKGDASGRKFRVNPLGADLQLFRFAQPESDIAHLAEPINAPEPLSVRLMALAIRASQASLQPAPDARLDDDYGDGESLVFLKAGAALPIGKVRVCDLRDIRDAGGNVIAWNHETQVPAGTIGFDPERGRVLLGALADGPLLATFHYGAASAIGGGEYERTPAEGDAGNEQGVAGGAALQPALDQIKAGGRLTIGDSLTYAQTPTFKVTGVTAAGAPGHHVAVVARNQARALIAASGALTLDIGARGRLILDGLVISGGALRLKAFADVEPRELVLHDCTLVPGLTLNEDGSAASLGKPSLIVEHAFAKVTLERCILGSMFVVADAQVTLKDCIVDAGAPDNAAYAADAAGGPGGELTIEQSTMIGKAHTKLLRLASNGIFFARLGAKPGEKWTAPLIAQRRQEGCVRFCYVPAGAVTPRRFHCAPDAAHPLAEPLFASLRYGDPGYAQLLRATSAAIRAGASNDSEMGVLNSLFQPQRETNLRLRLDEYLRFGLRAGIFFAS
jgi:hypothetical protein